MRFGKTKVNHEAEFRLTQSTTDVVESSILKPLDNAESWRVKVVDF
jgi:hypothetical protein